MSFDPDARAEGGDVRFTMHFPEGLRTVRVSGAALREYFGADDSDARLLDAYRANFRSIHAVAQQVGAARAGDIMVTSADLRAADHAGQERRP
ncbi:hypothetical protein [Bordetella bronchialis]|uniref:DUF1488 domain-containing protein n=1 Tax=Bordetella bronchialis TaxID=463025 RepID=A0A193G2B5_9BORD|nr:hypothetical protein [Bordetella bronchialis]ANN68673.1 hypothetical protein BAU06_22315 [Bordetella bronchialis]ANN73813.1 hypothetical protein BAU08_22845 [Bordetella bronchialis]